MITNFLNFRKPKATNTNDYNFNLTQGCSLTNKVLVGSHHKTGTVWLDSIFREICTFHDLIYYSGSSEKLPEKFNVFFQDHSIFNLEEIDESFRGLHIIRDPRDVIISGCFYHQKSREKWLHKRRKNLGGSTYQEAINNHENLDDKILFEMENLGRKTISDILRWNYSNPLFYEIKYEELILDHDLKLFHDIFLFLGFPGSVIPSLLAIAHRNSLFGGLKKQGKHIRSGKTKQWEIFLKKTHRSRFLEIFGDALIRLGYEKDNKWAEQDAAIQGHRETFTQDCLK